MKQTNQFIYGIYYPRNFANEYIVYRIAADRRAAWEEFAEKANNDPNREAQRITRRQAEMWTTKKWINGYEDFFGCAKIVEF